jgi:hypothetical protein
MLAVYSRRHKSGTQQAESFSLHCKGIASLELQTYKYVRRHTTLAKTSLKNVDNRKNVNKD